MGVTPTALLDTEVTLYVVAIRRQDPESEVTLFRDYADRRTADVEYDHWSSGSSVTAAAAFTLPVTRRDMVEDPADPALPDEALAVLEPMLGMPRVKAKIALALPAAFGGTHPGLTRHLTR